jgi:hypothetical protein
MICANPECDNEVDIDNLDICSHCFKEHYLDNELAGDHPDQTALGDFE